MTATTTAVITATRMAAYCPPARRWTFTVIMGNVFVAHGCVTETTIVRTTRMNRTVLHGNARKMNFTVRMDIVSGVFGTVMEIMTAVITVMNSVIRGNVQIKSFAAQMAAV